MALCFVCNYNPPISYLLMSTCSENLCHRHALNELLPLLCKNVHGTWWKTQERLFSLCINWEQLMRGYRMNTWLWFSLTFAVLFAERWREELNMQQKGFGRWQAECWPWEKLMRNIWGSFLSLERAASGTPATRALNFFQSQTEK